MKSFYRKNMKALYKGDKLLLPGDLYLGNEPLLNAVNVDAIDGTSGYETYGTYYLTSQDYNARGFTQSDGYIKFTKSAYYTSNQNTDVIFSFEMRELSTFYAGYVYRIIIKDSITNELITYLDIEDNGTNMKLYIKNSNGTTKESITTAERDDPLANFTLYFDITYDQTNNSYKLNTTKYGTSYTTDLFESEFKLIYFEIRPIDLLGYEEIRRWTITKLNCNVINEYSTVRI